MIDIFSLYEDLLKNKDAYSDMIQTLAQTEAFPRNTYICITDDVSDLLEIVDSYQEIAKYKLIFTKLDETTSYGNLLNVRLYSGAELSYMTTGQNVPDDIEEFNSQKIVKQLLGGR